MKRPILLLASVAAVGLSAGGLAWCQSRPSPMARVHWELADAIPFSNPRSCVKATAQEQKAFDLALSALEIAGRDRNILWLDLGAEKFLSGGIARRNGRSFTFVCAPDGVYARAATAITQYRLFSRGRLEEYELRLAAKLPQRSAYIVDVVANSAFNANPQWSEIIRTQDIRPFARSVLASFGKEAAKYSDKAFQQMSADDSLGTGAAQIAVATGHPDALPRVEAMMQKILALIPKDEAVPYEKRKRLDELSYAIAFGGKEAKNYVAPIEDLMTRKVQSWAPPFGMLEIDPGELCDLLKRIEGADAVARYAFCVAPAIPAQR